MKREDLRAAMREMLDHRARAALHPAEEVGDGDPDEVIAQRLLRGDTWARGISEQGRASAPDAFGLGLSGKRLAVRHDASGRGSTACCPSCIHSRVAGGGLRWRVAGRSSFGSQVSAIGYQVRVFRYGDWSRP
jgi:hypothetical protein